MSNQRWTLVRLCRERLCCRFCGTRFWIATNQSNRGYGRLETLHTLWTLFRHCREKLCRMFCRTRFRIAPINRIEVIGDYKTGYTICRIRFWIAPINRIEAVGDFGRGQWETSNVIEAHLKELGPHHSEWYAIGQMLSLPSLCIATSKTKHFGTPSVCTTLY